MHMQKRRHINIYIYTDTCAIMCVYTYLYIYIYTYIYMYTDLYTHTRAYMHTCIHAYMHTCIHSYIHTFIRSYVHTHITIQNNCLTTLRYVILRYVDVINVLLVNHQMLVYPKKTHGSAATGPLGATIMEKALDKWQLGRNHRGFDGAQWFVFIRQRTKPQIFWPFVYAVSSKNMWMVH